MKKPKYKTARIEIRCSAKDRAKLEQYAKREEMPLSQYLVACGLDCGEEMRK